MKTRFTLFLLSLFVLACNEEEKPNAAEGAHDAARMFINNVLDGNFDDARRLMIQDDENNKWLNETEKKYVNLSPDYKSRMRDSDPTIYSTNKVSDSVSIIYYSNSYNNRKDSVKVVRNGNNWLVDLKYTFPSADIPKDVQ